MAIKKTTPVKTAIVSKAKPKKTTSTSTTTSNKDLIANFMKHSLSADKELTSYGSTLESSIYF